MVLHVKPLIAANIIRGPSAHEARYLLIDLRVQLVLISAAQSERSIYMTSRRRLTEAENKVEMAQRSI